MCELNADGCYILELHPIPLTETGHREVLSVIE
jgi:hypothetical protein